MTNILHGEWIYGREFEFQYEVSNDLTGGQIDMQFQVDSGMVVDVAVYSDSLKPDVIGQIRSS